MSIETKLAAAVAELVRANSAEIETGLAESKDGKLTVSISCKLTQVGGKTNGKVKIAFSQKHSDEDEFMTDDPNQPELIGGGQ